MPIRPAEEATVITYTTAPPAFDLPETTQIDIVGTYRGSLLRKMSTPSLLATKQWHAYGSPLLYTVWQESDWTPVQMQGWFLKNFKDKEHTTVPKATDVDRDGISADSETINLFATKETDTMATTKNRNADVVPDTTTQTATARPKAASKKKASKKPATPVTILTADEVFAEKRDEIAAQVDTDPMPELIAAAVTDKTADEAPATPVDWDTDPGEDGPAEDETVTDEAPATPPADDVTPPADDVAPPADDVAPPADDDDASLMALAARIETGDADTQLKVLFLRDLLTKDDATIAAAIDADFIRIGKDSKPATATGNGHGRNGSTSTTATGSKSVPVVCSHCDKHFLGRANQVECRVCSDYEKAHGTPRPLTGKAPATPKTPKAAAKKKAGGTHRLH